MNIAKSRISYQSSKIRTQATQCHPEGNLMHPRILTPHGMEGFQARHESFSEEIAKEGHVIFTPQ